MFIFIPAAASILAVTPLSAPGPQAGRVIPIPASTEPVLRTIENSRLACRTADAFTQAMKQAEGDAYLMSKLKTGECKLLPAGAIRVEAVTPDGQAPAQSCVKPQGYGECWWLPTSYLK